MKEEVGSNKELKKVIAFCNKYNIHLSEQQMKAVQTIDGQTLLIAVPGSGKTTTLITRLGYMIETKKIDPCTILSMTYTKEASLDMKRRFEKFFGSELSNNVEIRTINAISNDVIRMYAARYGRKSFRLISDEKVRLRVISGILTKYMIDYPTENDINEAGAKITYIKNMMLNHRQIEDFFDATSSPFKISNVYDDYQEFLINSKQMDYDDQMVYALRILNQYPDILSSFQSKYRYICVDEAQDTSYIQHKIINLLAGNNGNIFMVGDEDQSIYGFRAAYPQALMEFRSNFPNANLLFIEQNFRSTKRIVDVAKSFIDRNEDRYRKNMTASREQGTKINILSASSRADQYKKIANAAKRSTEETAVLYRNNESVVPLIDEFLRRNIPFKINKASNTFFTNRVVIDIIAFLKLAFNRYDAESFMQIYYKGDFKCTKRDAERICYISKAYNRTIDFAVRSVVPNRAYLLSSFLNQLASIRFPPIAIKCILNNGYEDYMKSCHIKGDDKIEILDNIASHVRSSESLIERLDYLNKVITEDTCSQEGGIILSTIHSSKGLEFEKVYIVDVVDHTLPVMPFYEIKNPDDNTLYQEERRLFYVAMTRAKNKLILFNIDNERKCFVGEVSKYIT